MYGRVWYKFELGVLLGGVCGRLLVMIIEFSHKLVKHLK